MKNSMIYCEILCTNYLSELITGKQLDELFQHIFFDDASMSAVSNEGFNILDELWGYEELRKAANNTLVKLKKLK